MRTTTSFAAENAHFCRKIETDHRKDERLRRDKQGVDNGDAEHLVLRIPPLMHHGERPNDDEGTNVANMPLLSRTSGGVGLHVDTKGQGARDGFGTATVELEAHPASYLQALPVPEHRKK